MKLASINGGAAAIRSAIDVHAPSANRARVIGKRAFEAVCDAAPFDHDASGSPRLSTLLPREAPVRP